MERLIKSTAFRSGFVLLFLAVYCAPAQAEQVQPALTEYERPLKAASPAFNPPSKAKITLGEKLFFETRLSGSNTMSCASCHKPNYAWTDPRRLSIGETGEERLRRTPTLEDVGWNAGFARDGRIETLEGFILGPIAHPKEMNQNLETLQLELGNVPAYRKLFYQAFETPKISLDHVTQSLAAFIRTITSGTSKFDHWVSGDQAAIGPSAKAGFALFTGKAGCVACHSGWRFTDQKLHDIGLKSHDLGRGQIEPDNLKAQYAFKTPSLRNVANRAPYMHDGSMRSLADVIDFYTRPVVPRNSLSPHRHHVELSYKEKRNLLEFMLSLTNVRQ